MILLLCQAFAAEPSVDLGEEADLQFRLGIEAYQRGDAAEALEHLLASNRLVPNRNVVYNIARSYEQLGRFAEAFRHYSDFIELEPDPSRRGSAERARDALRTRVALVRIVTDPPGATVYIDRIDLGARGRTPRTLALPPGVHQVLVAAEGFEPAAAPVDLAVGKEVPVELRLARTLGEVQVDGGPAGAEIRLDDENGPLIGTLPSKVAVPPGPHVLVVTAPGHRPVRQLVQVDAKVPTRTAIDLPLVTGTLVVDAAERGALIEIDGRASGFTPAVLPDVPAGPHTVRVTLAGYRPFEARIEVAADGEARIEASMRALQEVTAASRSSEDVDDAPASVSIVASEEIRAFGYQTVYQALSGVRGLYPTDDRTYQSIGVRGFARLGDYGNRLLVTLDGHTLNDDQLGASYVGHDLLWDLEDLDRIEVVRGPGSALYGTNAFFGVVNLVPFDQRRNTRVGVAADGVRQGRVSAGTGVAWGEDGGAWASAGGVLGQGEDFVFAEFEDGLSEDADRVAAGGLAVRVWKGDWTVQAFGNTRDKGIPTGAYDTVLGDDRAHTEDTRGFAELRWRPAVSERVDLDVRAYGDAYGYAGDFPYDEGLVEDRWSGAWFGAETRVLAQPTDAFRLTAGGQVEAHALASLTGTDSEGTYLDEEPRWQVYSAYAVADLDGGWIDASLGARLDAFSTVGVSANPRLGIVLHPAEAHTVKVLAGSAFRAPSPYELSYSDGGITQVASEDLSPETVRSGELEYGVGLSDTVTLVAAAYYNEIDALVELVERDGLLQYQNSSERVRTIGEEIEVRRAWRQGWMLSVSQSLQRTRAGSIATGEEQANSPLAIASLKAAAPILPGVTGASAIRFESPRRTLEGDATDIALVWDLTVTGRAPAVGLDWGFGVRNLLDWKVTHPGGEDLVQDQVPQPRRTVFAEVEVGF